MVWEDKRPLNLGQILVHHRLWPPNHIQIIDVAFPSAQVGVPHASTTAKRPAEAKSIPNAEPGDARQCKP